MDIYKTILAKIHDRYLLHRYIFPFLKRNKDRVITPENTICVFSFPRSGSTWFSELLLTIPNSCLFAEPLMRSPILSKSSIPNSEFRKVKEVSDLEFYHFQPIPENENWLEASMLFEDLLKGKKLSIGLYDDYGLERLKKADLYTVRFNYANLLCSWLIRQFNFTSIFLVRQPFAVIASLIQHPYFKTVRVKTGANIAEFRYNKIFKEHERIYKSLETPEEYYAFLWCLNIIEGPVKNYVSTIPIVFYEDLLLNFDEEITRIFRHFKKSVPDELWQKKDIPSQSTHKKDLKSIVIKEQLNSWKRILSKRQIKGIKNILEYFEIEIYECDLSPNHNFVTNK